MQIIFLKFYINTLVFRIKIRVSETIIFLTNKIGGFIRVCEDIIFIANKIEGFVRELRFSYLGTCIFLVE